MPPPPLLQLERRIEENLRLGLDWLRRKQAEERAAITKTPIPVDGTPPSDPRWSALYDDDGSSLHIYLSRSPGKTRAVQVLKVCISAQ